jgi:hypothetical protein
MSAFVFSLFSDIHAGTGMFDSVADRAIVLAQVDMSPQWNNNDLPHPQGNGRASQKRSDGVNHFAFSLTDLTRLTNPQK